jgi:hypothetical protein
VAVLLAITLADTPLASAAAERWTFLDWWSFFGTLATVAGLILGFLGVYIAIRQINKTLGATAAAASTARGMWQHQLSSRLSKLTEVRDRIEKCARTDDREEMRRLLDEWVLVAKEAQGIIAQFDAPQRASSTDYMSELGLAKDSSAAESGSQYATMASALTGAASAARNALRVIDRSSASNKALLDLTRVCRNKISDVVDESAGFQMWLSTLIVTGRMLDNGA